MSVRLNKVLKEFNIGLQTVVDLLAKKGYDVVADLNTKITEEEYNLVKQEFGSDRNQKKEAEDISNKRASEKKASQNNTNAVKEIKTVLPGQPKIKIVDKNLWRRQSQRLKRLLRQKQSLNQLRHR